MTFEDLLTNIRLDIFLDQTFMFSPNLYCPFGMDSFISKLQIEFTRGISAAISREKFGDLFSALV